MAEYTVRRDMKLDGKTYGPGDAVPMERLMRERPELARKLLDQRRVVPKAITVDAPKRKER